MKKLSFNPDPDMKWIYNPSHIDYNSDHAEDLRRRRANAIRNAPLYMRRDAELNDITSARQSESADRQTGK